MPYGFSDPRGFFDSKGNIIFGPEHVGLTCSTIILAIFELSGASLVKYDSWQPRPEDVEFQRNPLRQLRRHYPQHPDDAEHFSKVEHDIGNVRVRPLEVAGAALSDVSPVDFAQAIKLASGIGIRISAGTTA